MKDGDGNNVFLGSNLPYSQWIEGNQEVRLRSGLRDRSVLPESRRAVLRYIIKNPGSTAVECAAALQVASVVPRVSDFVKIGYIKFMARKPRIEDSRLKVTPDGLEAYAREYKDMPPPKFDYDVYVPPKQEEARRGAEDAAKIKSRGFC